jgi:hypothetical protein
MRTRANIHLDADAYEFALAYANAKGLALGAAVSELLRQRAGQMQGHPKTVSRLKKSPRGYLVKRATGRAVTAETVKETSGDDLA